MRKINIKGTIVPSEYDKYYEYVGIEFSSPKKLERELEASNNEEIEVYINSNGGVVEAGIEMYTLLKNYQGDCKIYIIGAAYSSASIVAMARTSYMSPTSLMMVHCASTSSFGNHNKLEKTAEMLKIVDEALCNAYILKAGMTKKEALNMMEVETWLTAEQAKEKNLIDGIMFEEKQVITNFDSGVYLPSTDTLEKFYERINKKEEIYIINETNKLITKMMLAKLKGAKN